MSQAGSFLTLKYRLRRRVRITQRLQETGRSWLFLVSKGLEPKSKWLVSYQMQYLGQFCSMLYRPITQ